MKLCSVVNCDRPVYARAVCQYHYQLARRAKPVTNPRLIDQSAYYRTLSPGRPRVAAGQRKVPATVILAPEQLAWANAQPGGRSKAIRAVLTVAMKDAGFAIPEPPVPRHVVELLNNRDPETRRIARANPHMAKYLSRVKLVDHETDPGLITQAELDHALETAVTVTDENSFD